jgi:ankyrin repeat protein
MKEIFKIVNTIHFAKSYVKLIKELYINNTIQNYKIDSIFTNEFHKLNTNLKGYILQRLYNKKLLLIKYKYGRTILHDCAFNNLIDTLHIILNFENININILDDNNDTPLNDALYRNNYEISNILTNYNIIKID